MATETGRELITKRHPTWIEWANRWRWLRESYEGGDTYRRADYGTDLHGYPRRNLIRHKHEVPIDTTFVDPATSISEDRHYWLRLERTPVPCLVSEAIETHLAEIYSREIERKGGTRLDAWWGDVDGTGLAVSDWMLDTVAPYLLALGCLDLLFDRPRVPAGQSVTTRADQRRLNLDRCVASIVMPECVVWWEADEVTGRYREVLVRSMEGREVTYRHWTTTESTLYKANGEVIETIPHSYGMVPMVRVYDRKKPTCKGVGVPRYESIAEIQRESYNRESELVLAGAIAAHPTVQGPEDYIGEQADIPIGPGYILPKKKTPGGSGQVTYEGWEYVDPPSTGAESGRADLERYREQVDRAAKLTKPAGAKGTTGSTVAQSGISKTLDQKSGNALLSRIAIALERVEMTAAEFVQAVLGESSEAVITYPRSFDLLSAEELASLTTEIQAIASAAGELPTLETALLRKLAKIALVGADEATLEAIEQEIEATIESKAAELDRQREAIAAGMTRQLSGSDQSAAAAGQPDPSSPADPAGAAAQLVS